jgi:hypothetical protein
MRNSRSMLDRKKGKHTWNQLGISIVLAFHFEWTELDLQHTMERINAFSIEHEEAAG